MRYMVSTEEHKPQRPTFVYEDINKKEKKLPTCADRF